jgi:hypothetical protein
LPPLFLLPGSPGVLGPSPDREPCDRLPLAAEFSRGGPAAPRTQRNTRPGREYHRDMPGNSLLIPGGHGSSGWRQVNATQGSKENIVPHSDQPSSYDPFIAGGHDTHHGHQSSGHGSPSRDYEPVQLETDPELHYGNQSSAGSRTSSKRGPYWPWVLIAVVGLAFFFWMMSYVMSHDGSSGGQQDGASTSSPMTDRGSILDPVTPGGRYLAT